MGNQNDVIASLVQFAVGFPTHIEFSSNWLVDRLLILPTTSAPKPGQKRLMLALRNFNRHRLKRQAVSGYPAWGSRQLSVCR